VDRDQVLFRLFGKYCPEGTILFAEGAPGDAAFVIQSGAVRLGRTRHGGPAGEDLGPGELLGEECFLAGAPRRRRAETVRDSRLLRVNERTVDAFVRQSPESARNLLERFMAQGERTRRELEAWTVAHLLRRAAPHLRESAAGLIRPADLAERAGIEEEDAALVLDRLERAGCLTGRAGGYRSSDAGALERGIRELTAGEAGA